MYKVRALCEYGSGWHYIYEEQETLDSDITCDTHSGSTITDFIILEDTEELVEEIQEDFLKKDNEEEYSPSEDYHPATKKYVDDRELNDLTDINFDSGTPIDNQILTYNSASGKWKAESIASALDKDIFYAYDSAGGDELPNASWLDLTLDTEVKKTSAFSHDSDSAEITILTTGTYEITSRLVGWVTTTDSDALGAGKLKSRIMRDTGSGYVLIPGTEASQLGSLESTGIFCECEVTTIIDLNAGDKIKMQGRCIKWDGVIKTWAGGVALIIQDAKASGLKGDKGDTGSGSTITVQDEGTPLSNTPNDVLNFTGAGVTVSPESGSNRAIINIPGGGGDILLAFSDKDLDYTLMKGDNGGAYVRKGSFIFKGTSALGTPTNIKALTKVVSTAGKIRIYDATNANTICENTNISNTSLAIVDLGTISNLPSGEAIFEIQCDASGTKDEDLHLHGIAVQF